MKAKKHTGEDLILGALIALVITLLTWLVSREGSPGTVLRGLPFPWYSKWIYNASEPKIDFLVLFIDYVIVFVICSLVYLERKVVRKLLRERQAKKKAEEEQKRARQNAVINSVKEEYEASKETLPMAEVNKILGSDKGEGA